MDSNIIFFILNLCNILYVHLYIQSIADKIIPELRDLSYEERLKECGLTTLETRKLRGDQIEVLRY